MTKRSKVFITVGISACLAFGIAGCAATTEEQGPTPTAIATATVAPTATPSASVALDVKTSAAPSAAVSATQEVKKPTGNSGEKNQSQGQNGKSGNKTQQAGKGQQEAPNTNVAPAPENPAPPQESTAQAPLAPPSTPAPKPAPEPTPPSAPTPEPPQSGYAHCSCGAKLAESEIEEHMVNHAINGESCSYTTY